MQRGLLVLTPQATLALQELSALGGAIPREVEEKLAFLEDGQENKLELTGETVESLIDLLPPPHLITSEGLSQLSQALREFGN